MLGADQCSKIDAASFCGGYISKFQLDSVRNKKSRDDLINLLLNFNLSSGVTIFLFASPEALMLECWNDMVLTLISRNILRLLCIDEVHLFVEFACTFRPDFCKLKGTIFKEVLASTLDGVSLKIPVLCMTASFTEKHLTLFQTLSGFQIFNKNTFWCGPSGISR